VISATVVVVSASVVVVLSSPCFLHPDADRMVRATRIKANIFLIFSFPFGINVVNKFSDSVRKHGSKVGKVATVAYHGEAIVFSVALDEGG